MKNVEFFDDGSGGVCRLEVVSSPFTASVLFFFDEPTISEFVEALEHIDCALTGEAKLGQLYEEPNFVIRGDGKGHVFVSGVLSVFSEHFQRLEFAFTTDQTALGPFISDLKEISSGSAI